jgi:hypothetical protein
MKKTPADRMKRWMMLTVLAVPLMVLAADAPSLELLEFLGDWESSDGKWQDPLDFMQDTEADPDALGSDTQDAKVEDEKDAK